MNKKGFTLIEVISVIVILSLLFGLATVGVTKLADTAKEKALKTKIKNIEKAAVLYAQENNLDFNVIYDENSEICTYCRGKNNCYCASSITVEKLIEKGLIETDDNGDIQNPMDTSKSLNGCKIDIYKKYGHIYAVYIKTPDNDKCYK